MDKRRCLKIALRMDSRLRHELNEGIDAERMVADALYARDVLLVCDAMAGSDAQDLARLYRKAAAQDSARPLPRAPMSIAGLLSSLFGSTAAPKPGPHAHGAHQAPGAAHASARRSNSPPSAT